MSASLLSVVSNLCGAYKKMDSPDPFYELIESKVAKIKPEFQNDFREQMRQGSEQMPRIEFLLYWESDKDCQDAIREVLGLPVSLIRELADAIEAVAEWKP